MNGKIKILLVEDNEGDIVLTLEALKVVGVTNEIHVIKDGEEAQQFLGKQGIYEYAETPGLIILDINLPKIDGIELLTKIKQDNHLKLIPVVMLTTSNSENDVLSSYMNYANCYITKPVNFQKFIEVAKALKEFWIDIVHLPMKK